MFVVLFTPKSYDRCDEPSGGLAGTALRAAGLRKLPRFPGTLLDPRLSALKQIDHKRLPKQHQNSKYNQQ